VIKILNVKTIRIEIEIVDCLILWPTWFEFHENRKVGFISQSNDL